MSIILSRWLIFLLWVSIASVAVAQEIGPIAEYQVIFDDFEYDAAGYPNPASGDLLFGSNAWFSRNGDASFRDQAWYYYQWRWHALGRTMHPSAKIQLIKNERYGSLRLTANAGYTRRYDIPDTVPLQIQSGFLRETGTWSINARFDDLEQIPYFTQAFWIISPIATSRTRTGVAHWSEFNFEWQNWFALDFQPDRSGIDSLLINDIWAPENFWVRELGYEGAPFPEGKLPANKTRTYMANGIHMYGYSVGAAFENGQTAGGIPLRNALLLDSGPFTCYLSSNNGITHISDPVTCMDFIADRNKPEHWVQLTIQYDGADALFSLSSAQNDDSSHVFMSSRVTLNERSLPLLVTLGIHPPDREIVLSGSESSTMEIDWFYYSPKTDLTVADIQADVLQFRSRGWSRVNLDQEKLSHEALTPWRIEEFLLPEDGDNTWSVRPTMRLTNGIEVQWIYRTRDSLDNFFSEWSGWQKAGLKYELPETPYEAEVDVRIKDHNASDHGENPYWANVSCVRYNYVTQTSSNCTGGEQSEGRYSFEQFPRALVLDQIYPNPVRDEATIRVGFRNRESFELAVFDTQGRKLFVIADSQLPPGFHLMKWNPEGLASGQYFLSLSSGKETQSLPFTLIR